MGSPAMLVFFPQCSGRVRRAVRPSDRILHPWAKQAVPSAGVHTGPVLLGQPGGSLCND